MSQTANEPGFDTGTLPPRPPWGRRKLVDHSTCGLRAENSITRPEILPARRLAQVPASELPRQEGAAPERPPPPQQAAAPPGRWHLRRGDRPGDLRAGRLEMPDARLPLPARPGPGPRPARRGRPVGAHGRPHHPAVRRRRRQRGEQARRPLLLQPAGRDHPGSGADGHDHRVRQAARRAGVLAGAQRPSSETVSIQYSRRAHTNHGARPAWLV